LGDARLWDLESTTNAPRMSLIWQAILRRCRAAPRPIRFFEISPRGHEPTLALRPDVGGGRHRRIGCASATGRARGRRRRRRGGHPDPLIGNRHAVAVEAVAPADVADLPLNGWSRVHPRLIDGSGRVYRRRVHRVGVRIGIVRIGVIRGRERGAQEEPADEGGTKAAAEAMEPMMEATMMEATMEAATE